MKKSMKKVNIFIGLSVAICILMLVTLPVLAERRGSIFQMAGNIRVEKDEIIDGSVDAMAGSITVYGTVNDNVTAMAGTITIHGIVNGDVRATAGNIYIRKDGKVVGDVTALAGKIYKDDGATITGSVVEMVEQGVRQNGRSSYTEHWGNDLYISPKIPWYIFIWGAITGLISWLALGALLMLFFAKQVQRLGDATAGRPVYYFFIGLLAYMLVPPMMVLMAITIVGLPVAFLLIIAVILGTIMGQLGIARILGDKIGNRFHWQNKTEMFRVLTGIFAMFLISIIPVLGWLFFFVTGSMGFGSALINRFGIEKKGGSES